MINTTNAVSITDGATGFVQLSIIYKKVLNPLLGDIDKIIANVENYSAISGGTAIYYVAQANVVKNYVTASNTMDTVAQTTIEVQLDQLKTVSYTIETLDLTRLGAKLDENGKVSEAFANSWSLGMAQRVQAYLYVKLLGGITAWLKLDAGNRITALPILTTNTSQIIDYGTDTINDFLQKNVWLPVANQIANFQNTIDRSVASYNRNDFTLVCSPFAANVIALTSSTVGSDLGYKALQEWFSRWIHGKWCKSNNCTMIRCKFTSRNFKHWPKWSIWHDRCTNDTFT